MNEYILQQIKNQLNINSKNIIGIHGPQGIGKTSLNKYLKKNLNNDKYNVIFLSLDDFYLKINDMKKFLSESENNLYKFRGFPGTHDIDLLYNTILNLINEKKTYLPVFDKTIENGFGDRVKYNEFNEKYNIIVFEGWMIGYEPLINNEDKEYDYFNDNLKKYKKIQDLVTIWICLETDNLENIIDWRFSAEPENGMNKKTFLEFMKPYFKIYNKYSIKKDKIIVDKNGNIINKKYN